MSTITTTRNVIGANRRPGTTPGGFTQPFSDRSHGLRVRRRATDAQVKRAAEDALGRRGLAQSMDAWTATAREARE